MFAVRTNMVVQRSLEWIVSRIRLSDSFWSLPSPTNRIGPKGALQRNEIKYNIQMMLINIYQPSKMTTTTNKRPLGECKLNQIAKI